MKGPQSAEDMLRIAGIEEPGSCFVVMSFSGNPIIEAYYEEGTRPTIEACGLKCVRVDQEHFDGTISSRIRQDIDEARIVVVDLTEDRPNCYFEAGFALARGKRIIFQRLQAPGYQARYEFDVKDYPHIVYGTIDDLRRRLGSALAAAVTQP